MLRQGISFALSRLWASSTGELVVVLASGAAVFAAVSLSGLVAAVVSLITVAFLWVHCARPALLHFRVSRIVFLFAAVWTVAELAFAGLMIADEVLHDLGLERALWLAGQIVSLAYVVVVGLAFWPKYSILIRLFGRMRSA